MKKSIIEHLLQKNRGFTLIELVLTIAICSIILIPLYSILNISSNVFRSSTEKDELLLNAEHSIDYIKNEIRYADIIMPQYKLENLKNKYPDNIGFLLVFIEERADKEDIYKFVTYYTKNKKLIRMSLDSEKGKYPTNFQFAGHNELCRMVDTIENTEFDIENHMIYLDFDFKSTSDSEYSYNIKSDIYVRCEIDY